MFARSFAAALVTAMLFTAPAGAQRFGHGPHGGFAPHPGFFHHPGVFARPGFVHRPFSGRVFVGPLYGTVYPFPFAYYAYPYGYYPYPYYPYPWYYPYP